LRSASLWVYGSSRSSPSLVVVYFFGSAFVVSLDLCVGGGLRCPWVGDLGFLTDSVTAGEVCGGFSVDGEFFGDWNLAGNSPRYIFSDRKGRIPLWWWCYLRPVSISCSSPAVKGIGGIRRLAPLDPLLLGFVCGFSSFFC